MFRAISGRILETVRDRASVTNNQEVAYALSDEMEIIDLG